ncbi:hypothetical protein [Moorena sp. SIO3I8]|nr:hypothetical protein [Moorena sp. SIO3I8]NEO05607.1 hypothetical protein [Moorena sp. SIO3I8]NEO49531.1 hypothetical protein [Moorena sp. SIO4A3]
MCSRSLTYGQSRLAQVRRIFPIYRFSQLPIADSRLPTPDSRFPNPDS